MTKGRVGFRHKEVTAGTILTALLLGFYALQLTVPVISDESITMANAAWVTGRDWRWMIASLGGNYYRYLQAMMTVPLFCWLKDPAMIYRLSMLLQAIAQASIVPVVYGICRRHLKVESKKVAVLMGMAVCLIPTMALYTFYYRGDYLLGILPWYVLLFFLETMRAAECRAAVSRGIFTMLSVLGCVLAYMAHSRGLILIIALVLSALAVRIFFKKRSLNWLLLLAAVLVLAGIDHVWGQYLKEALYSYSGLTANAFETMNVAGYFQLFSFDAIKDLAMLCLSWMATLISTTQGLVLLGLLLAVIVIVRTLFFRMQGISSAEKATLFFCVLVFAGYYAIGALFFRGTYFALRTGELTKRVDRLLYDRYSVCGAGMIVFVALYVLCCRREWLRWKERLLCALGCVAVLGLFVKKVLPTAVKYKGYLYNAIVLNTFNTETPDKIMFGGYYAKAALLGIMLVGSGLLVLLLLLSLSKKHWIPLVLLGIVLASDLVLLQVNFIKVRKATNDYVAGSTGEVVDFMRQFEDEITADFPYVLKGKLPGVKIQFYQPQLMNYRFFGKAQEKQLHLDNYFIVIDHEETDPAWPEGEYYLFEDFDYENAKYDVVYVKGQELKDRMEQLGYAMREYQRQSRPGK